MVCLKYRCRYQPVKKATNQISVFKFYDSLCWYWNQLPNPVITSNKMQRIWSEKSLIYWSVNTLIWDSENKWDRMQNISSTPTDGKLQGVNIFWGRRKWKKYLLLEEQESQRHLNKKEEISHCQRSVRLITINSAKHQHYLRRAVLLPLHSWWKMWDTFCSAANV